MLSFMHSGLQLQHSIIAWLFKEKNSYHNFSIHYCGELYFSLVKSIAVACCFEYEFNYIVLLICHFTVLQQVVKLEYVHTSYLWIYILFLGSNADGMRRPFALSNLTGYVSAGARLMRVLCFCSTHYCKGILTSWNMFWCELIWIHW